MDEKISCKCVGMLSNDMYDKMFEQSRRIYSEDGLAPTLHTCSGGNLETKIAVSDETINEELKEYSVILDDKRVFIRILTPREYFRLQGVKDADFDKVAVNQTDGSLRHLAGDSICVNVLMAIFGNMITKNNN